MLSETDANAITLTYHYDQLGRMDERRVNGTLNGAWHYDNAASNKGLGLLDKEDGHPRSDGTRLVKEYFYSDTTNGRKDLEQVGYQFSGVLGDPTYTIDYHTDGYYGRLKGMTFPSGIGLAYEYSTSGYLTHEKNAGSGFVYREITARDVRNQVTASQIATGNIAHSASYAQATGQMLTVQASEAANSLQDLAYAYDYFGNLTSQTNGIALVTESYIYDDLHRLTSATRDNGEPAVSYSYDPAGNLTAKSDFGTTYYYQGAGPNRVSSVDLAAGGSTTFSYDNVGNLTSGNGKTLTYNGFNKPRDITAGGVTASFTYGADLSRYLQVTNTDTTLYLDKAMEVTAIGNETRYRHYVSDVAVLTKIEEFGNPDSYEIGYLHRDRLGSITTISDHNHMAMEPRAYDAFGKPRNGDWTDRSTPEIGSNQTDRGFTDHEHLDESQLIHMNGRAYDYQLGRFFSVDPIIQAPGNSQSLNPYAYIMNNPLSGTDPTGYQSTDEETGKPTIVSREVKEEKGSLTGSNIKRTTGATVTTKWSDGSTSTTKVALTDNGANFTSTIRDQDGKTTGQFAGEAWDKGSLQQVASMPMGGGGRASVNAEGGATSWSIFASANAQEPGGDNEELTESQARNRIESLLSDEDYVKALRQAERAAGRLIQKRATENAGTMRSRVNPERYRPVGSVIADGFLGYYVADTEEHVFDGNMKQYNNWWSAVTGGKNWAPTKIRDAAGVVLVYPGAYYPNFERIKNVFGHAQQPYPVFTNNDGRKMVTYGTFGPFEVNY